MLTIYRRHTKRCEHRKLGRQYRRCRCPVWVDGFLAGEEIRESLKTRDWQRAQEVIREWEAEQKRTEPVKPAGITVEQACEQFLQDAGARQLREPTLYKYRLLFGRLKTFAADRGLRFIAEVDLTQIRVFRASWPDAGISALKKLERLRSFFRFAQETGWVPMNPAAKLKNPKIEQPPTMPFTSEEMVNILAACDKYPDGYG